MLLGSCGILRIEGRKTQAVLLSIEILARLVLHASGLAKGFHFGIAELAPLPFRQAVQGKRSEVRAVQLQHLVTDCRTHAFHLALPTFMDGDFHIGFAFGDAFDAHLGGQRGAPQGKAQESDR